MRKMQKTNIGRMPGQIKDWRRWETGAEAGVALGQTEHGLLDNNKENDKDNDNDNDKEELHLAKRSTNY